MEMAEIVTCEKEFHYEKDFVSDLFFIYLSIYLSIYLLDLNNSK